MRILVFGLSVWAMTVATASGQDAAAPGAVPPAEPVVVAAPAADPVPLAGPVAALAGTLIEIEIVEPVTSRTAKRGDRFQVRLRQPVMVGDQIVLPAGTHGVGEVVDASKAGFGGRPGELLLAARYLEFEGRQIPVRSFKMGGVGRDNMAGSAVVTLAAGFVGLIIQGGEITYPAGFVGNAKLAVDVPLGSAPIAPAALAADAPAPVPIPASSPN